MRVKRLALVVFGLVVAASVWMPTASAAAVHVTICHRTGSASNPYVQISPSAGGVYNGHLAHEQVGNGLGGDIIPPFTYRGVTYSKNWDATGMGIFNNGCKVPPPPTCDPNPQITTDPTGDHKVHPFPTSGAQFIASVTITTVDNVQTCEPVRYALASYQTEGPTYPTSGHQVLVDSDTVNTTAPGTHVLLADVGSCFFQVDFVRGLTVFPTIDAGVGPFYGSRLVAWDIGVSPCIDPPS
jgi:hypothetical protein